MNTNSLIGILKFKNNLQNFSMSPIKSFMAWYNATGKENHKSLFEKPLKDRCGFCGETKVIKCNMAIVFSEFEYENTKCCRDCYSANAIEVKAI